MLRHWEEAKNNRELLAPCDDSDRNIFPPIIEFIMRDKPIIDLGEARVLTETIDNMLWFVRAGLDSIAHSQRTYPESIEEINFGATACMDVIILLQRLLAQGCLHRWDESTQWREAAMKIKKPANRKQE